jgi:hypothetical protein
MLIYFVNIYLNRRTNYMFNIIYVFLYYLPSICLRTISILLIYSISYFYAIAICIQSYLPVVILDYSFFPCYLVVNSI